jgi:ABC-type nitrate/sulfonate/bicarbonate transport system substrate-binding protein
MVTKAGDWIKGHPGNGVEAMAKAMGVQTKELALPIAKLLKSRHIKKRGQKRATKYFPG